jgi:hypothetical protein
MRLSILGDSLEYPPKVGKPFSPDEKGRGSAAFSGCVDCAGGPATRIYFAAQ